MRKNQARALNLRNNGRSTIATVHPLSVLALSLALIFCSLGCGKEDSKSAATDISIKSIKEKTPGIFPSEDLNDLFDQKHTLTNSIDGKWRIYDMGSTRTDAQMSFFKDLVKNSKVLIQVDRTSKPSGDDEVRTTLEVQTVSASGSTQLPCKVSVQLDAKYCCFRMLTFMFIDKNRPAQETPVGCSNSIFGADAQTVSQKMIHALIQSPTSPIPAIYHFTHNKGQNRIRLQNPPSKNKTTPIENLETEIHLVKEN